MKPLVSDILFLHQNIWIKWLPIHHFTAQSLPLTNCNQSSSIRNLEIILIKINHFTKVLLILKKSKKWSKLMKHEMSNKITKSFNIYEGQAQECWISDAHERRYNSNKTWNCAFLPNTHFISLFTKYEFLGNL